MLELRILTGLHRGAALPLEGDTIRLGSAAENDIVLLDPGMPALACAMFRSGESDWRYRACASARSDGEAFDAVGATDDTALVAGARWFAGPVLIGCDEEGSPWPAGQPQAGLPEGERCGRRPAPFKPAVCLAFVAAIGAIGLAAALALRSPSVRTDASDTTIANASDASDAPDAPDASDTPDVSALSASSATSSTAGTAIEPVRVVSGTVYPNQAVRQPPFEIRSASAGPYGFVVTRDDQVLMPGSRLGAFTLVRVEPGRAVFTGPHAAELTW